MSWTRELAESYCVLATMFGRIILDLIKKQLDQIESEKSSLALKCCSMEDNWFCLTSSWKSVRSINLNISTVVKMLSVTGRSLLTIPYNVLCRVKAVFWKRDVRAYQKQLT